MIHLYCGDGKGKTTAAMGLALRMAGAGKQVLVGQFFKNGSSSEIKALSAVPGVETLHCVTVPGLYSRRTEQQRQQARRDYTAYLTELLAKAEGKDLLVLDEAVSACRHGSIPEETLLRYLDTYRETMEIVLTGREPSEALQARADYITEMCKRRHPFDRGIRARKGVEF